MTRRRAIRLSLVAALCLLLGAATTVGVAWECAIAGRMKSWDFRGYLTNEWQVCHESRTAGSRTLIELRFQEPRYRCTVEAGWPSRAVRSRRVTDPQLVEVEDEWRFVSWEEGLSAPLARWNLGEFGLPVLPLFPGFALDTALYAAAWWALLFTPSPLYRAGRRRFRVSRGMCGACGYDLNGSPGGPCPECGAGAKA